MARQSINADCEKMHNLLDNNNINLDNCRKLIKSYVDLVSFKNSRALLVVLNCLKLSEKIKYWFVYSTYTVLLYFGQTRLFH